MKGVGIVSEENNLMASDKMREPVRKEPKQISFRVSENEYEKLKSSAETLNMSVPNFVKSKAKNSRLVTPKFSPDLQKRIAIDLSKLSSNANQIARVVNTKYVEHDDLLRNIESLRKEVNQIWQLLR